MNRNSNKLKSFGADKIISFEDFGTDKKFEGISNRYMIGLLESLTSKGIHVIDMEEPEWGTDGMIEVSETTTISFNTGKQKKLWGTLELPNGTFVSTKKTEDLDEALNGLEALKNKHNIKAADYTNESATPIAPTPYLKEQRATRVDKATKLVESAIEELKKAPKLDTMSDIPELIEKLKSILADDNDYGLANLAKLYKDKK